MSERDAEARIPWPPIRDALTAACVPLVARRYALVLHGRWLSRPGKECFESRSALAKEFEADLRDVRRWERGLVASGLYEFTSNDRRGRKIRLSLRGASPLGCSAPGVASPGSPGSEPPGGRARSPRQTLETQAGSKDAAAASGTARPRQKADRDPKPPSAHAEVVEHFCAAFLAARGAPYVFKKGKDGQAIKNVLAYAAGDVAEVKGRIDRAFADEWWRGKLAGLAQFASEWNRFAPTPEEAEAVKAAERDRAERIAAAKAQAEQLAQDIPLMESGSPAGLRLIQQWRQHGQTDAEVIASLKDQIEQVRRA